ncbi:MAG TPA: AAA family ATPase [Tepidisphaeraceae bacterium]|nr:AAA family ATPase [Tepidisphaeraceae bacterium]
MAGRVILLSGPVGAGKTTVARELIPLLAEPVAYIEGDTLWAYIARSGQRSRRENFVVIMRSMTAAALPFARTGFNVLLDFSIPPDFLPTAGKILKEVPFDFVVLRPSQAVCESRAASRAEGRIVDYGPYRDFYALFIGAERFTIEDDQADCAALAAHIHDGLDQGLFRVKNEDAGR